VTDADARALVDAAAPPPWRSGSTTRRPYAQLRLGPEGPVVIEVGARLGGGKDAELARLVTGVDTVGAVIDAPSAA
jgi:hypothetical protein